MLTWLKDNLFNRWSFNLLIWHGLRMILRIGLLIISDFINLPFTNIFSEGFSPIYLFLDPFSQVFIIFPPIIVFFLEKKYGWRFTPRFFQNKLAFLSYILLVIPALIVEIIIFLLTLLIFAAYFSNYISLLFSFSALQEYFVDLFKLDYLTLFFIWIP